MMEMFYLIKKILLVTIVLVMLSNTAFAFSIPYKGFTPKWDRYLDDDKLDSFFFSYDEEIKDGIFKATSYPEKTSYTYNTKTREVVERIEYGLFTGTKTSHWINTNVKLGDQIEIGNYSYQVVSLNSIIELSSIGKMSTIELTDGEDTYYYDKTTGIKLKTERATFLGQYNEFITDSGTDTDNDGLSDFEELFVKRTDPTLKDTDNDGLDDTIEINIDTNPNNPDSDGDGLNDGQEVNELKSNPLNMDTDGDGVEDHDEYTAGTNPLKTDSDDDGLSDNEELTAGTNPLKPDSDDDGLSDNEELTAGTNPLKADTDGDLWGDDADLSPTSIIIPNGLILLILIIVIVGIKYKRKNTKVEE